MRAAQSGDRPAYSLLLRDLTGRLRRIVRSQRSFLGDADIEDVVQDVLLSVHTARASWDPGRPFLPWLFAIIRNRLADTARQYARQKKHEVELDLDVTFLADDTNGPLDAYGDPDALRAAIERLPAAQRTAIEMLKLKQWSLKDAAAASGSSISALKVSVHRAMTSLRKTLKDV
ncbi:MAG: sigma-70 family RNA polymerase sigma factor [Proteobacteria bacterium]|nr:sigma-70 family RNA polymerase sigma factor [Pseudomonadota bacterium]